MLSFREYCKTLDGEESPDADFAADALRDRDFPWDAESWYQIRAHLAGQGACRDAIEASASVWRAFRGDKTAPPA
jgi:hypothetical protein